MYPDVSRCIQTYPDVSRCIQMCPDVSECIQLIQKPKNMHPKFFTVFFFREGFWEGQKSLRKYAFPALLFSARLTAKRPVSPISWAPHK